MKHVALGLALVLFLPSMAAARLVSFWPYEKLYEESDLVAIVELGSVSKSKVELSGHGETDRFDGKIAQLAVGKVLKGKADIKTISLLHFAYSKKVTLISNGAFFIDFSDAEKYQYLVFLKKGDKGSFIPVTGHYDAAVSVKKIVRDHISPIKKSLQPPKWEDALRSYRSADFFRSYDPFEGAILLDADSRFAERTIDLLPPEFLVAETARVSGPLVDRRQWLEQAVVASPNDPRPYLLLADTALGKGRRVEAKLLLEKAKVLSESFEGGAECRRAILIRAYSGRAGVASRRDWETEKMRLQAWLNLEADNAAALQLLARVLFQLGDPQEALVNLKKAKAVDPNAPEPATQLAIFYYQAGDSRNAQQWMDYAGRSAAEDLYTQLVVARWHLETSDLDRAETLANRAMQLDPNSQRAKMLRGVIALYRKDYEAAADLFDAVVANSPDGFAASNNLALALCEQQGDAQRRRALQLAEENVRLYRGRQQAIDTYFWVVRKVGRLKDADRPPKSSPSPCKSTDGSIPRQDPSDPDTAFILAKVAAERDNLDEAKRLLRQALKSNSSFLYRDEADAFLDELTK